MTHRVADILVSGKVAEWQRLFAEVDPQALRQAVADAPLSDALRALAQRLLDSSED